MSLILKDCPSFLTTNVWQEIHAGTELLHVSLFPRKSQFFLFFFSFLFFYPNYKTARLFNISVGQPKLGTASLFLFMIKGGRQKAYWHTATRSYAQGRPWPCKMKGLGDLLGKVAWPSCSVNLKPPVGAVSQVADRSYGGQSCWQVVGHVMQRQEVIEKAVGQKCGSPMLPPEVNSLASPFSPGSTHPSFALFTLPCPPSLFIRLQCRNVQPR